MNHPDSDTILKFALETLEAEEHASVGDHLGSCAVCGRVLDDIREDIKLISGLKPETGTHVISMPPPRRSYLVPVFRAAAILIAGVLTGYYLSESSRSGPVTVVQQRLEPVPAITSVNGFAACDVIDISSR